MLHKQTMSGQDVMGASGERGIDVALRYQDIRRIIGAMWREPQTVAWLRSAHRAGKAGRRLELDDLIQDCCLLVIRRQGTASAFDPDRGSFSRYVRLTAFTVASHGTDRTDLEAPLTDPATMGSFAAIEDSFTEGVRAYVSANETALTALAREIEADAKSGQQRLFDVTAEFPQLRHVG